MRPDFEDETGKEYQRLVGVRNMHMTRIKILRLIAERSRFQERELNYLKDQVLPEVNLQITAIEMQLPEAHA